MNEIIIIIIAFVLLILLYLSWKFVSGMRTLKWIFIVSVVLSIFIAVAVYTQPKLRDLATGFFENI